MKKLKRKRSVNKTNQSEMENESKVSLKLLVDTKSKKVLFAEAGKDFVDFLFHIMSLPVGTVVKLLNGKGGMVGCLGSLYKSIESLNDDYLQPDFDKDAVLQAETRATDVPLLLLPNDNVAACMPASAAGISSMEYFMCNLCYWDGSGYVTDCKGALCPKCGGKMCIELKYFRNTGSENSTPSSSNGSSGGYVKGVVTYMVMDDLQVTPMSTISGITLISKFRVKDVSALEEKDVRVGLNEGLAMLKASLETNTVLTTVFIP